MALKTDYVDSQYSQKKYKKTLGQDGYYRFEDTTVYSIKGDNYGAEDLNKQNREYNRISGDYQIVSSLINKIEQYGIQVSSNSWDDIIDALNRLAKASFDEGYEDGVNEVKNEVAVSPGRFGLVTDELYQSQVSIGERYDNKITNAINTLNTEISFPGAEPTKPQISFYNDPITQDEANAARSALTAFINAIYNPFVTFTNTAISVLNSALSILDV